MPADRHRCATENITTSGYITYSNDEVIRISGWLKLIDLGYSSSLSVAWMVRFWFKSFQNSTVHKRPLVQGSLFLLAVISIKCLSICAPSFATVVRCDCGALRVIARLKRRPRPELYLVTSAVRHYARAMQRQYDVMLLSTYLNCTCTSHGLSVFICTTLRG